MALSNAVALAGQTRLRPILMTAFSSVIGLAPLAFGVGQGNGLQKPMAVAVMGGILVATFLSLVVMPALYVGTEEILTLLKPRHSEPEGQRIQEQDPLLPLG
jgi:HAE1 family hydrophobic/amphiphilic exporter-1